MKTFGSLLCLVGLHKWLYRTGWFRMCMRCSIRQERGDDFYSWETTYR